MKEPEVSPRKKRKIILDNTQTPSRRIPFRPLNGEAMFTRPYGELGQDVNVSMSSSIVGPSSSVGSFSSCTTISTSFSDSDAMETEETPCPLPQIPNSNTAVPNLTFHNIPPTPPVPSQLFGGILDRKDTIFEVCSWLPAKDLINLYAVSSRFHTIINQQITTLILGNAQARMPESAEVFHFKAYKSLCMFDAARNMSRDKKETLRDAPTLRWLSFLEHREAVVNSIIVELASKGHRLPRCTSKIIKKIWFLIDIPETKRRIGCVHNQQLWSDTDLFLACMFFMKLDMACTDPISGCGERRVRAMLLAQRTLTVMDKVLKREMMRNQYEMLQMYAEWGMDRATALHGVTEAEAPKLFFGILPKNIGSLRGENWIANAPYLVRPDELIIKESIRRGLRFQDKLIDMMLWGNVHPVTRVDVYPTNRNGEVITSFENEVEKKVEQDIALFLSKEMLQCDSSGFDVESLLI